MDEQGAVYSAYQRANSYFQNTEYAARSLPDAAELALLTPMKRTAPELFSVYQPPVSRGDGFDRANLLKADALLNAAGWTVKNQRRVNAATGKPLRFELPAGRGDRWCCRFSTTCSVWGSSWIFVRLIIRSTATAAAAGLRHDAACGAPCRRGPTCSGVRLYSLQLQRARGAKPGSG